MTSPLKILIVSNSEDDTINLLSILRQGGYTPSAHRVDNFQDFKETLGTEAWEIIFYDYQVQDFGAEVAWQLVRDGGTEIPFVVLDNFDPQEESTILLRNARAIDLLKQGVTDYLDIATQRQGDQHQRLLQVLARELTGRKARRENIQNLQQRVQGEIAEQRKIAAILRESEERFQLVSQIINDAVWVWQRDNNHLWWSEGFHFLFGYELQSLVPTWELWVSLIHPEDCPRVLSVIQGIMDYASASSTIEYRFRRQDGSYAYVLDRLHTIRDFQGQVERVIGSMIDLSDRYRIEKALRTVQERCELAICAGNIGVWDWNLEQSDFYIDSNLKNILGYTDLDIPNSPDAWYGMIHPEDRDLVMTAIQDYLAGITSTYLVEHRKVHKNGTTLWFLSQGIAFAGATDQLVRIAGTETEITERKKSEAAIHEKALLLDLANDIIVVRNLLDQITFWNQKAVEVYGYTAQEAIGQYIYDLLPTAFPQRLLTIKNQLLTQGRWEGELIQTKRDGTELIVSSHQALQLDTYGNPRQILEINTDITAANQAKAALQEANRRWQSLLDNIQLVVVEIDQDGRVEYTNPFFLELTGYTTVEVLGQDWLEKFIPLEYYQELKNHTLVHAEDFATHYQNPILTKGGEERIIAWNNTLLQNLDGAVSSVIAIGEDITDRQIISRMKDEFISVISHELRTPLTAIRGSLGLLAGGFLEKYPDKSQRMIEIAAENTDRLTRLINDILDIERIESGKMDLLINSCSPLEMIQYTLTALQPLATRHEVILELPEMNPAVAGLSLLADRDRLLQVLINLISNAIKFSPPQGKIQVAANIISCVNQGTNTATSDQDYEQQKYCPILPPTSNQHILFQVRDQGIGIPADQLESIFERFHQIDASDSRRKGGTGLGLAICRNIIRQHGGVIWAESQLGKGSTFLFSLPLTPDSLSLPALEAKNLSPTTFTLTPDLLPQIRPRRVLVVENDPDLAKVLLITFEHLGIDAYHAPTGRTAIQMCQELDPDLLLLDIVLPDGDGFSVVDWLRMSRFWAQIPLIVYSALELNPQERHQISLGPTEYFTKGRTNPEQLGKRAIAILNQNGHDPKSG